MIFSPMISSLSSSWLAYREASNSYTLILDTAFLHKVFMRSRNNLVELLGSFKYRRLTSSFSMCNSFSFSLTYCCSWDWRMDQRTTMGGHILSFFYHLTSVSLPSPSPRPSLLWDPIHSTSIYLQKGAGLLWISITHGIPSCSKIDSFSSY